MRRGHTRTPAAALLLVAGMGAGCVTNHGTFTIMTGKLVRTQDFSLDRQRVKDVVGRDVANIIIIIPTKGRVTLEEALDDALEKGGGDVMTDVKVKQWNWYIPYLFGESGWEVRGDVVKTRKS